MVGVGERLTVGYFVDLAAARDGLTRVLGHSNSSRPDVASRIRRLTSRLTFDR